MTRTPSGDARREPDDPDRRLLRRATRDVAVRTAAAAASVVVVTSLVVLLVDERAHHQEAVATARTAAETADDLTDPPRGTWLLARTGSTVRSSPGTPEPVTAALDPAALPDGETELRLDGREVEVWTAVRSFGRVSAVADLGDREAEEQRLRLALAVSLLVGVLGAGLAGAVTARRAVRPLGDALVLRRRFVADASHELRAPLTVLLTRAQLLRREAGPEPAPGLDQLVADATAVASVVDDLLVGAQLAGRPLGRERVDVAELAGSVVASMSAVADRAGVELGCAVGPGHLVVTGTSTSLRRAVTALCDNALRHTPAGGTVRVRVTVTAAVVSLAVVDDGEGLDAATSQQLLKRSVRGPTAGATRRLGLGLSLADEVARGHGGRLSVDGRPGQGAHVTLHLPQATPERDDAPRNLHDG